jgi:long-chain acyl-CoA synthetase
MFDRNTLRWRDGAPPMRAETHFGSRVFDCYSDRPASTVAMLRSSAARNGEGIALVDGNRRLTWAQTELQVEQLARGLAGRGIAHGERVALWLSNCLEFPIALWAIARAGAIAVPISHRSRSGELCNQLNHSGAAALIYGAELTSELPSRSETPDLRWQVSVGADKDDREFHSLLDAKSSISLPDPEEEDTALILYTSGTTGVAKGAMISHLNLVHAAMTYEYCMQLTSLDRSIISVPMSHVTGIAGLITTVLRCASTLVIQRAFKAAEFLWLAARENMTHTMMVPAMYNLCLLQPEFETHDLTAWRVGGFGGALMPPATIRSLAEKVPNLRLMNCYGATETVAPVAIMPYGEITASADRVGRAIPGATILIMSDDSRECRTGTQGEVWIHGPTVIPAYWRNRAATEAELAEGYWRSGDIGSMTSDGLLGIHDRIKDMVNRGGYKVFTTEVENVLSEFPSVLECAVVSKPCPVLGERVHAFVSLREGFEATGDELSRFCQSRLSDYKIPESFTIVTTPLPRNANGKILKNQLRDQIAAQIEITASETTS